MKILGYILIGCVALAVLRFVAIIIVVANIGVLIWGICTKPKQTIGAVLFGLLATVLGQ